MSLSPNWWESKDPVARFKWACAVDSLESYAIGMLYDETSGLRLEDKTGDSYGPTLLMTALYKRRQLLGQHLIQLGADVDATNWLDMTPLCFASVFGFLGCSEMLVRRGANVNHVPKWLGGTLLGGVAGETALHGAARGGHRNIVIHLAESGADVNSHEYRIPPAVFLAAANDHREIVRYLADHGADLSLTTFCGLSLVDYVVESGRGTWPPRQTEQTVALIEELSR
ncbi:MAG: ankyrin repeat domain-containing protein [Candidatus Berkelbacteria bacterium]